ncbi:MAG: peptidoglycan-binding domain-containing protein [Clostridia bacterium]|nr:peptidoglycan-binding domain-containing protein [Clostridia bacterium]
MKAKGEIITVGTGSAPDVRAIQKFLNSQGYVGADGNPIEEDGIFGSNTEFAVVKFQQESGLDDDGLVGDITWSAMGFDMEDPSNVFVGKEHTKNARPSSKNKHEQGQSRKKRDNGGEKGDARRNPNPNKRKPETNNISVGVRIGAGIIGTGVIVGTIVEDVLTGGAGTLDDPASLSTGVYLLGKAFGY